jgi:hypothetical protein
MFISKFDLEKEAAEVPYHRVTIDHLVVDNKTKCLTATCCFSRHTTWIPVEKETAEDTLKALTELQSLKARVRFIYCDRATCFNNS